MKAVITATVATLALLASGSDALAEVSKTPVTVANFVRAESDHMIRANMEMVGVTFGKFVHLREPTTPDNQPVIRMNQDTLYSATVLRQALGELGKLGFDTTYAFGTKQEVRPVDHLVAAGAGWGGLPRTAAFYIMASVEKNDGKTPHAVTVKDVPVDAFWSITVYNADGYLEKNEIGRNSLNNSSATPNEDGSYTIHFGGDPKRVNYLPVTEGWNYAIRMYQPRKEILDGSWTFPKIEPVK
jgi:hypothetical protein